MKDCKPEPAVVTMRARVLDVTPTGKEDGEDGPAAGNVD
jgi:cytochrome c